MGSKGGTQQTVQTQQLPPWQDQALQNLVNRSSSYLNTIQPVQYADGTTNIGSLIQPIADWGPITQQYKDWQNVNNDSPNESFLAMEIARNQARFGIPINPMWAANNLSPMQAAQVLASAPAGAIPEGYKQILANAINHVSVSANDQQQLTNTYQLPAPGNPAPSRPVAQPPGVAGQPGLSPSPNTANTTSQYDFSGPFYPQFRTVADFSPTQLTGQRMAIDAAGQIGQSTQNAFGAYNQFLQNAGGANRFADLMPTASNTLRNISGQSSFGSPFGAQVPFLPNAAQNTFNPTVPQINYAPITPYTNLSRSVSPNSALSGFLNAAPDLSSLKAQIEAAAQPAIDVFREQVLPQIGSEAQAAGQAGGSRRSLAEGVAASRLGRDISNLAMNLATQERSRVDANRLAASELAQRGVLSGDQSRLQRAGLDLNRQQLQSNILGQNANLALQGQQLGANIAGQNAGFLNQNNALLRDIFGQNANLSLQGQQLGEASRQSRTQEALQAANAINAGYSDMYGKGANSLLTGLSLLPMLNAQSLLPSTIYSDVGGQQQALNQAVINEQIKEFQANRMGPFSDLANYASLVQGNMGGTMTQQTPTSRNPLMSGLGGAALGGSLASIPALNAYALPLAVGGGLLGLFG